MQQADITSVASHTNKPRASGVSGDIMSVASQINKARANTTSEYTSVASQTRGIATGFCATTISHR